MNGNTKEAIKSGLEMGGLFGLTTGAQTFFCFNGMGHIPFNVLVNAVFPAVAIVGGFVAGYNMVKDSNQKSTENENDIILKDIFNLLDKAGATTEEKIAILKEQKEFLEADKEETEDKPKTR